MKKVSLKQVLAILVVLAFATAMTSCNRGYGCPNNFSIEKNETAKK